MATSLPCECRTERHCAGDDAQRSRQQILRAVEQRHLVGGDLDEGQHEERDDDPGVAQEGEVGALQVERPERIGARDESHDGEREEGAQAAEDSQTGS